MQVTTQPAADCNRAGGVRIQGHDDAEEARDRLIHAHTLQSASAERVRRAGAPRSCLASLLV